jgi:hypothetical protein
MSVDHYAEKPRVGITGNGKISMDPPANPGMINWTWCAEQASHALTLDNNRRFHDLIDEANRNNAAYPINLNGLASDRAESLRTIAENTDGIINRTTSAWRCAAFPTTCRRITCWATHRPNTKADGTLPKIDVKVLTPGLRVKHDGYLAPAPDTRSLGTTAPKGWRRADGGARRAVAPANLRRYSRTASRRNDKLSVVVELPGSDVAGAAWDKAPRFK